MRAGRRRAWMLATVAALALGACGNSSGGVQVDAGADGPAAQDDAGGHADGQPDGGPQGDAPTPNDGPPLQSDGAQVDGPPQADAAITGCNVATGQNVYWGNLHAHTAEYSDGSGTVDQAFAYARDTADLDIMVLTDHVEQIILVGGGYAGYTAKADAWYATGTYLAMAGFEYGSGFSIIPPSSAGHINVFFATSDFGAGDLDYRDFYDHLYSCAGCIGQFNHPGDGTTFRWDDFDYDADAAKRMRLLDFDTPEDPWGQYFDALTKGWSVSPMWNQDNHGADWGTKNDHRSGLWISALDRTQLYDAMLNNRTFATADKKAWIKLLAYGSCWMGSKLRGVTSIPITVEVNDTDNDHGFASIELFGPNRTTPLASQDCAGAMTCTASFNVTVPVPPGVTFALARATMTNGAYLVSAPVWAAVQ